MSAVRIMVCGPTVGCDITLQLDEQGQAVFENRSCDSAISKIVFNMGCPPKPTEIFIYDNDPIAVRLIGEVITDRNMWSGTFSEYSVSFQLIP